jgi:MoxR-like ATPase
MNRVQDRFQEAVAVVERLQANVETVVRGKSEQIRLVLAALAAQGHVLFEDVPGTAKTVLSRALAGSVEGAEATRIQCTPDLQPTDVTGLSVWDPEQRRFEFRPGPVFAHVVLVDEINRALPKAQSALLEAMAERQVTVDGHTRRLAHPFLLLATENSVEQEGTFPLPEAQLDRFLIRTELGYPSLDDELAIVDAQLHGHPLAGLRAVVTLAELDTVFAAVEEVYVDPLLKQWAVELVRATRELDIVEVGASVRGSLALERVARAWALVHGRDYVEADDLERLFPAVILHRIVPSPELVMAGEAEGGALAGRLWRECTARAPRPEPSWDREPAARA